MAPERNPLLPEEADIDSSLSIRPDDESPWGKTLNEALRKARRPERFRTISTEVGRVAEGIWTMEEAIRIAGGVKVKTSPAGGNFFYPPKEDYQESGDDNERFETFRVEPGLIQVLVESGVFKRKPFVEGKEYMLFYAPDVFDRSEVYVEMTHQPSKNDIHGRESITLHFMK
jgi:hypothetical protein